MPLPLDIETALIEAGILSPLNSSVALLAGGVSREILWIVEDGLQNAVNRALPQLRLQAGRFADPVRNRHEKDDFKYVGKFVPSAAPAILFAGDDLFTPKWKQGLHIGRHRGPRVGFRGKSDHAQNLL